MPFTHSSIFFIFIFIFKNKSKTFAYLLPVLQPRAQYSYENDAISPSECFKRTAIIVAPTRELAVQLASDVQKLLPSDSRVEVAIDRKHLPEFDKVNKRH